jgi:hypothetical protein
MRANLLMILMVTIGIASSFLIDGAAINKRAGLLRIGKREQEHHRFQQMLQSAMSKDDDDLEALLKRKNTLELEQASDEQPVNKDEIRARIWKLLDKVYGQDENGNDLY